MLITVVMSVYNCEKYVEAAIESIINQSFENFQFIIVDNASNDGTTKILKQYAKRERRIKVIRNETNLGMYASREVGIYSARTAWVALMDADDIAEPIRLERQAAFIRANGSDLGAFGSWGRSVNDRGEVLGSMTMEPTTVDKFRTIFVRNETIALLDPSSVIHRKTFQEVGGYRPEYSPAADIDLWYRIAESGRTILVIPEFLMRYRVHGQSTSIKKTMFQRQKTHLVNYNMRRRRSNFSEITWTEYQNVVWSNPWYRIPRQRNDFGLFFLKHAGLSYAERKVYSTLFYLVVAMCIKPLHVVRRIASQLLH